MACMTELVRRDSLDPSRVRARGESKSIDYTSMHRVKHEEMNESSAHGVPVSIRRLFITVLGCSHI